MNTPLKLYTGMYLGIVIQNNDPERRGRVKVYIPYISAFIYDKWFKNKRDKKFKFPGNNIDSDLSPVMDLLKDVLPWSENCTPAVGNSIGTYNASQDQGTVSDSSNVRENSKGLGKPGAVYEKLKLKDVFSEPTKNYTDSFNINGANYQPTTYSKCPYGIFGIPSVGSHVWVTFKGGDPLYPIVMGAYFGQEEWKSIYDVDNNNIGLDYPGGGENKSKRDKETVDSDQLTYRNKFVINQKGGTFEIISTDRRETVRLSHSSGSFKEYNNKTAIEFVSNNSQGLILGDSFLTTKGNMSEFTGKTRDIIVVGDRFQKIGIQNPEAFLKWKEAIEEIQDLKQLFDIKRCESISGGIFKRSSGQQSKDGDPCKCPVCSGTGRESYFRINDTFSSFSGVPKIDSTTDEVASFVKSSPSGAQAAAVFSQYGSDGTIFGASCKACNGSGFSPSSMDGTWKPEDKKEQKKFIDKIKEKVVELAKIEEQLGEGGSEIINIAKHKIENIGLVLNDFGSIRVDMVGKIYVASIVIETEGVYNLQKESPLFEYVHVQDLPGGTYTLNVANKWDINVGAGGYSMKSLGPVNIGGSITNITGEQLNLTSRSEININSDTRMLIEADMLVLKQKNKGQVLVDSSLGVTKNVIIGGGLHVEGELTVHHITAPVEIQETEQTKLFGKLVTGKIIGYVDVGSHGRCTVYAESEEDCVENVNHSHNFKNIPLTLVNKNDDVRSAGKSCNDTERVAANPVNHSKK